MAPVSLVILAAIAQSGDPSPAQTQWIKDHCIPLKTVEAGNGFDDLEPLAKLIGSACIVALGEPTHGTREAFQLKHRLVEFLSQQMGFSVFSIEANMPEAFAVDDYVSGWRGSPQRAIAGMYFWTWNTQEVLAMVRWMRQNNEKGPKTIRFTGFDMQTPDVAMKAAADFLEKVEPAYGPSARSTYDSIRKARAAESESFGVATGAIPIAAAAGKHLALSGWIRTQGVQPGFAGLWCRVDGKGGGVAAFDNMSGRGATGDSDWTAYKIELDVPADASSINFGVLMPGKGTAWFDDLKVELGGVEFADPAFDFTFEGESVKGLASPPPGVNGGYTASIDHAQAHSGKASLRLAGGSATVAKEKPAAEGPTPPVAAKLAQDVLDHMVAARDKYVRATSDDETDWAIQNARVVAQCFRMKAGKGFQVRDECMAANVKWILDNSPPNTKIILWAHNGHVNRQEGCMGSHLAKMFGKDYFVLGFAAASGQYTAMGDGALGAHDLSAPPPGSFESRASAAGLPLFILPTRGASTNDDASSWLTQPIQIRSIGALAMDQQFATQNLSTAYDAVAFLKDTTAARQIGK